MRLLTVLLGWLVLSASAVAFGQEIEVGCLNNRKDVSADEIKAWLRSGDRSLVAWGAYYAGQSEDDSVVTLMERLLQGVSVRADGDPRTRNACQFFPNGVNTDAYILDALIQRRAIIPAAALTDSIRSYYPFQSLILVSFMPTESSTPLLEKWFAGDDQFNPKRNDLTKLYPALFFRATAMMLSKSPPPGFAAGLLAGSEERLVVRVTDNVNATKQPPNPIKPVASVRSKKILCGSDAGPRPEGLPPRMQYSISENEPAKDGNPGFSDVLAEAGGDTIRYLISSSEEPRYSDCPADLNRENKDHLLMEMIGPDARPMPWSVDQTVTLRWQDNASYLSDLRMNVEAEQARIHEALKMFADKGLIDRAEIDAVAPRLIVEVRDERKVRWDKNHPVLLLPKLKMSDRNLVQIP
jgi:hypothetical protein